MYSGEMSYREYREIIAAILGTGRYCDYADATPGMPYVVLRHDVEFSVERAFALHLQELEAGIRSSWFFQLSNNAYNILSHKNAAMVRQMHKDGQHIGLHYHMDPAVALAEMPRAIRKEADILSEILGFEVRRFSLHRPKRDVLENPFTVEGMLSTYSPMFFTFSEVFDDAHPLEVKYIADSMHKWKYGYPNAGTLAKYDKVQVLIHPYSWTEQGHDNLENFRTLLCEKQQEIRQTIDSECVHFKEVKDEL